MLLATDKAGKLADELELTAPAAMLGKQAVLDRGGANPAVGAVGLFGIESAHDERVVRDQFGSDRVRVQQLDVERQGRTPEHERRAGRVFAVGAVDPVSAYQYESVEPIQVGVP